MKFPDQNTVLRYKREFPPGTRILLLHMEEAQFPIPDYTRGTIRYVDDIAQLHCRFDNGRSHTLVPGLDKFRKLTEQEAGGAK